MIKEDRILTSIKKHYMKSYNGFYVRDVDTIDYKDPKFPTEYLIRAVVATVPLSTDILIQLHRIENDVVAIYGVEAYVVTETST